MDYAAFLIALWGLFSLQTLALNLVVGEMGLMSLCQAAFFGVGAYAAGIGSVHLGMGALACAFFAPAVAFAFALLLGAPLYRLEGDEFALATFTLSLVFYSVILQWTSLTGGGFGLVVRLDLSQLSNGTLSPALLLVIPIWTCVAVMAFLARKWRRAPLGRVLNTIREHQLLALSLGRPVRVHRMVAFVVTAVAGGIAGYLYALLFGVVDPSGFDVTASVMLVAMVVIGGAGSSLGAIIGAALIVGLPEMFRFVGFQGSTAANLKQLLFGVLLYVIVAYRPRGIVGRFSIGVESRT